MLIRNVLSFLPRNPSQTKTWRAVIANVHLSRMASTLPRLPVFEAIAGHDPQSSAVVHSLSGRRFTYGGLLKDVADAKYKLREAAGDEAMEGQRIAFLVENGYDYVGAMQVPIGVEHSLTG